jgi:hypothetical protein
VKTVTARTLLQEVAEVVVKAVTNPTKPFCFCRMRTVRAVRTATWPLEAVTRVGVVLVITLQIGETTITPRVSLITIRVSIITIAMLVVAQVVSQAASVVPSRRWSLRKTQDLMRAVVFCRHQD